MIDFDTYERVKLVDVAEFGRAKEGHVYPRGTSTLQISATNGQIGYLDNPSTVEAKHVAIIPQAGINPKYFNYVLQKNIDRFLLKYKTGLNIQEKEIGKFLIELHNPETQYAIARMLDYVDGEVEQTRSELDIFKTMKDTMLNYMMV